MVTLQCRYMGAAYPDLTGADTCEGFHKHTPEVFHLASLLASLFQQNPAPTDEQIAWFLNDADAVIRQQPVLATIGGTIGIEVERTTGRRLPPGCTDQFNVNGVEFVIQDSEGEPSTPELRSTYLADRDLAEGDLDG
ncbi:hypothetical protein [Nesterenkonia flava]|uniref:Uncharacterized protein n=1 Tax=Nesterenkonia flava TaxID=469799 RepID=A0ABU1FRZ9_9MICC|nr:hypothetical protein [Nesterenkonia flava]MDR5711419.1 hypothetical protein [Nesterenkonia flava]